METPKHLGLAIDEDELDMASIDAVTTRLRASIEAAGCYDVFIDMSAVTFCDSTALNHLVALQLFVREHGGNLTLRSVTSPVARALNTTGLAPEFGLPG